MLKILTGGGDELEEKFFFFVHKQNVSEYEPATLSEFSSFVWPYNEHLANRA